MNNERVRQLNNVSTVITPARMVVYWMSRDQRVHDNWALLYAPQLAFEQKVPLTVLFVLTEKFPGATLRQYDFMLQGLQGVEKELHTLHIRFALQKGEIVRSVLEFCEDEGASALVTDFSPLRIGRKWREEVAERITIPFFECDAHNIIPAWIVSDKQEFGAYTIRPKVHRLLMNYLQSFPEVEKERYPGEKLVPTNWVSVFKHLDVDCDVQPVDWITPGEDAARKALDGFLSQKIERYDADRNDPGLSGQSDLSPYLHFGQISAQRIALEVQRHSYEFYKNGLTDLIDRDRNASGKGVGLKAFMEELVVRRELADNFCFYNTNYDSTKGFPDWAKESHRIHAKDPREFIYSLKELEKGKTHDEAWNEAQMEMIKKGKMHGYMRMYWAKKILEWTESPEQAMEYAIYLNDRYELDGRDPNGYAGIAWSLGGVHDRPWFDRPVFGKIRYMNYNGLKNKFDINAYIKKVVQL